MRDSSFAQFVLRNLTWMLASLFLAMAVWVAATLSNNPVEQQQIRRVPININLPEGYVLTRQPTTTLANVDIRTQRSEWELLTSEDVIVTADTSEIAAPGEYRLELEAEIASPRHGRVVSIQPSAVTITVDEQIERRFPVTVIITQDPPLGYSLPAASEIPCDPGEVVVSGSRERVSSVASVTVQMDLSEKRNPVTETYQLIPLQTNGRPVENITLTPPNVICSVNIQAREDVFQMRVLPNITGTPPDGYLFEGYVAAPETVGVTGDRSAISNMSGVVRTAAIDLSEHTGTFTTEAELLLPEGVSLVPENQLVEVTVTISPVRSSQQFQQVPVEITGLDPTLYRATVLPNVVTVLVVGPEPMLPAEDQVRVVVDLAGLGAGNHQVAPQGMLVSGLSSEAMTITVRPEQLNVTIESVSPTPSPDVSPTPAGSADSGQTGDEN